MLIGFSFTIKSDTTAIKNTFSYHSVTVNIAKFLVPISDVIPFSNLLIWMVGEVAKSNGDFLILIVRIKTNAMKNPGKYIQLHYLNF